MGEASLQHFPDFFPLSERLVELEEQVTDDIRTRFPLHLTGLSHTQQTAWIKIFSHIAKCCSRSRMYPVVPVITTWLLR